MQSHVEELPSDEAFVTVECDYCLKPHEVNMDGNPLRREIEFGVPRLMVNHWIQQHRRDVRPTNETRSVAVRNVAPISEEIKPGSPAANNGGSAISRPTSASSSGANDSFADSKLKCLDLGFKRGTEAYGKCVLRLSQ